MGAGNVAPTELTYTDRDFQEVLLESCRRDTAYFIENYVYIEDPDSPEFLIPFKLWPGQKQALTEIEENRLNLILKARQLGVTWEVIAYAVHELSFYSRLQHYGVIQVRARSEGNHSTYGGYPFRASVMDNFQEEKGQRQHYRLDMGGNFPIHYHKEGKARPKRAASLPQRAAIRDTGNALRPECRTFFYKETSYSGRVGLTGNGREDFRSRHILRLTGQQAVRLSAFPRMSAVAFSSPWLKAPCPAKTISI